MAEVKQRPDLMAELAECMTANGEVRIVHHVRANCITLEAINYQAGTCAGLLRNYLIEIGSRSSRQPSCGLRAACRPQ